MNNLTKVEGLVKQVGPTQFISERYSKRNLILDITDNPKYPNYLSIDFSNDKVYTLDNLNIGDKVSITIALRGRAWVDPKTDVTKYFNSLEGIGIEYSQINDVTPKRVNTNRVEDNLETKVNNAGSTELDLDDGLPF